LISLNKSFAKNANIKICVSSRPLLEFEEAFADFPSLELHGLTYDDITNHVSDRIGKHNKVAEWEPIRAQELVEQVLESAGSPGGAQTAWGAQFA